MGEEQEKTREGLGARLQRRFPFLRRITAESSYVLRLLVSSGDRFYWDNGFSRAAALAYTTLLSMVPLLGLTFGFLASFSSLEHVLPGVQKFIFDQFLPMGDDEVKIAISYVQDFSAAVSDQSVVVIPFIIITSLLLVSSIEFVINQIWQIYDTRPIFHRLAMYCAVLVVAPVFLLSTYYTTKYRVEPVLLAFPSEYRYLLSFYEWFFPSLVDYLVFFSLFYLVPKCKVRVYSAMVGAFFATFLFDVAKDGFLFYMQAATSYQLLYGALAAIPVFLFWLYLAWAIVLFGAEITYQAQYLPRKGLLRRRTLLSMGDGRFILAMQALIEISTAFLEGKNLLSDEELSERLDCSSVVLRATLDRLCAAGILSRDSSFAMQLTLRKPPERIEIKAVYKALFIHDPEFTHARLIEKSLRVFHAADEPMVTLGDILDDK